MIEALNQNPSLEGLFANLKRSSGLLRESDKFKGGLDPVYVELAKVVNQRLMGEPVPFSWQSLLRSERDEDKGKNEDKESSSQQLINVTPVR